MCERSRIAAFETSAGQELLAVRLLGGRRPQSFTLNANGNPKAGYGLGRVAMA